MGNFILSILPILLLIILVIVLYRLVPSYKTKTNWKKRDWISFATIILGAAFLGDLISMDIQRILPDTMLAFLPVTLFAILLILVLIMRKKGKIKPGAMVDERVEAINAKSARNTLLVTYLSLIILFFIDAGSLSRISLIIVLAAGLLVFIASIIFYSYRSS